MTTIKRRVRRRLDARDSLPAIWNRLEPPPAWAFEPGEHHDTIIGLVFDMDGHASSRTHPHLEAWRRALVASGQ